MQPRDLLTAKEAQVALMVCATSLTRGGVWRRLELALYLASHGGTKWQGDLTPAEESPARIAASGD